MPQDFEDYLAYVIHMRAEHKRLREWLLSVRRQWPLLSQRTAEVNALSNVMKSLKALSSELAHHFEEEETGGCLEEAVSHRPSLSNDAIQLTREHPLLLKRLDQLIERIGDFPSNNEQTASIAQEFKEFAEQLHAHELAENRILEESFGIQVE